ncbi:hypothetical protein BaRGS_00034767 [Batillaria attramentaria]|uniref:Uncharacterized protein n=1 Tax=Batillaria attramentaria TaxID=370345 RepID=A0ABD0JGN5_9CAEN
MERGGWGGIVAERGGDGGGLGLRHGDTGGWIGKREEENRRELSEMNEFVWSWALLTLFMNNATSRARGAGEWGGGEPWSAVIRLEDLGAVQMVWRMPILWPDRTLLICMDRAGGCAITMFMML